MALHLCHPYVWEDPRFIFKSFMYDGSCMSELVNRAVLVYAVSLVLGFIVGSVTKKSWMPLFFGIIATCFLIPTFMKMKTYERFKDASGSEGFKDASGSEGFNDASGSEAFADASGSEGFDDMNAVEGSQLDKLTKTTSSARNPFQNVMVDDYKYAPTRAAAPDMTTPEAKIELDAMFRTQWYSDPTDVFGKSQSQRMFVTQPNTTVPNDQDSYQKWLYKVPGKTCKEGNYDACYGGSGGAVIPWLDAV